MEEENFQILNKTKSNPLINGLFFRDMKNAVLGKKYDLSLVFIGSARSRKMNRKFRGKDKPANILSFPLSEESGEIFIDLSRLEKESRIFEETPKQFLTHLFVHGLYHLKGMEHGDAMETAEVKTRKKFGV
jgi:probable rRNA maturation factor